MTAAPQGNRVVERMRTALATGRLPSAAQEAGARLLRRLSAPVRLAIFGLRGTGKTRVRDVLVGGSVLPPEAHKTSVELAFGSRALGRLTYSDGSEIEFDGVTSPATDWEHVALVRLQMPLPVLERISLLQIAADSPRDDLLAALNWVVRRCDMMLWCTRDFSEPERLAWATVPDRLRDHTFLVPQLPRGALFPNHVRDEVAGLLPLHREPGPQDGAARLRETVLAHVDRGRAEDFDGALLFLERFRAVLSPDDEALVPVRAGRRAGAAAPRSRPVVLPTAAPLSPAFEILRAAAEGLSVRSDQSGPCWPQAILEHCVATVESLPPVPPAEDALSDLIAGASDLMLLLRLEGDPAAAADAVSLLVQIRRAVELRLAA